MEALCRRECNRACTAKNRASETQDEALCRQERNRGFTAKKRDLKTIPKENRAIRLQLPTGEVTVECAISAFHAEVKLRPDFVCTCCHRMMYWKSVIVCNGANYTKASTEILQEVFSSNLRYISSAPRFCVYMLPPYDVPEKCHCV